jgi:hypothetical protein
MQQKNFFCQGGREGSWKAEKIGRWEKEVIWESELG